MSKTTEQEESEKWFQEKILEPYKDRQNPLLALWKDLTPMIFKKLIILAYKNGGATMAKAVINGLGDFANEREI